MQGIVLLLGRTLEDDHRKGSDIYAASCLLFATSARFEVALQPALQENWSCTMAVRGLMGGRWVMVCDGNEIDRGGGLVVVEAAFASSSTATLSGMP